MPSCGQGRVGCTDARRQGIRELKSFSLWYRRGNAAVCVCGHTSIRPKCSRCCLRGTGRDDLAGIHGVDAPQERIGWGTWIRTKTNRVRVCCATVTPFPKNHPRYQQLSWMSGHLGAAGSPAKSASARVRPSTRLVPGLASIDGGISAKIVVPTMACHHSIEGGLARRDQSWSRACSTACCDRGLR